MPRHFHDDDVPEVRPAEDNRSSSTGLILAIVGVVVLVGLGGLALVGLFFFRMSADREMAGVARAQAVAAQRDLAAARAKLTDAKNALAVINDPFLAPNPPATEGPPTDLGPDREAEKDGNWTVLFRSDDPAYWNTAGNAGQYAVPVSKAPAGVRFLRLKNMKTSETLIVAATTEHLTAGAPAEGAAVRWNGTNKTEYGGRHLGIIQGPRLPFMTNEGTVSVMNDGRDAFAGSGFGHKHSVEGAGQRYAWRGQEIVKTAFEIAVTEKDLTDEEKKLVVGGN